MQVEHHPESRLRQYQLTDRARAFGWPAQRCLVIDDDLGISGAQSSNRPGYQRLVSMVALREVGVVFGLEVSRLARNCLDWYQLLEWPRHSTCSSAMRTVCMTLPTSTTGSLLGSEGHLLGDRALPDHGADAARATEQSPPWRIRQTRADRLCL